METSKHNETTGGIKPPILPPPKLPRKPPPFLPVKAAKRPAWIFLTGGLFLALVIGSIILALGFAMSSHRMGARAVFTIDWKKMPDVSNDGQVTEMRKLWREALSGYMAQEQGNAEARAIVAEINQPSFWELFAANKRPPVLRDEQAAIASIKRNLRVTDTPISDHEDQVVIQMSDSDTNRALVVVGCVMNRRLSEIALQKVVGSVVAANINENNQDIEGRMASIREELWSLSAKMQAGDQDANTMERYRELKQELEELSNKRDLQQFQRSIDLFDSPISVKEPAHIVN